MDELLRRHLPESVVMALVTAVLTIPILGVRIHIENLQVTLEGDGTPVYIAMAVVFLVRLFRAPLSQITGMVRIDRLLPSSDWLTRYRTGLLAAMIVLALIWPFVASRGAVDIATLALIYVMLGLGLNIVVGFAGLLDLGYVAFYAVGAYSYALLNQHFGLSFWECLPISIVLAGATGCLLGFPVLRLRGDYLAIVTLGFGEIIRLLLNNLDELTGGPDGIGNIPKPTLFGLEFARRASTEGGVTFHDFFGLRYDGADTIIFLYLIALLLALFTLFVSNRLLRMPVGRAWEALREDEIACRSLGLNPTLIKLSAFSLGASFGGMAGAFFAARQGFINPESFTFIESAIVLAIVVLGGMGSQLGVILAAVALTALPEVARQFDEYRMLIFGLIMVLMMIWRPQGLLPATRPRMELPQ
ncbi:MAG: high-affinity branched-chain amino acid ABC transporter permease LivM [Gammaproteobacteria bacterium]|nr:high-affinity branched-chain amino acid ABC transporter permease LivM [Gammaproteobacteria bacterium]MCP5425454.1 high-affinity branched-chain amino acid ABC transporter permease LivM [Gammaproteobacteria bacterium]